MRKKISRDIFLWEFENQMRENERKIDEFPLKFSLKIIEKIIEKFSCFHVKLFMLFPEKNININMNSHSKENHTNACVSQPSCANDDNITTFFSSAVAQSELCWLTSILFLSWISFLYWITRLKFVRRKNL